MAKSIEQLDTNMKLAEVRDGLSWYDIRPLGIEGRMWKDTARYYDRFPSRAQGAVPPDVWDLSRHSAGFCTRFITNANTISARWTLKDAAVSMDHMPATGVSGLDLYMRHRGEWRWIGIGRPQAFPTNTVQLTADLDPGGEREFLLFLPLYNGVEEVQIGIAPQASFRPPATSAQERKPICVYGTSIVQGGCASRPGMAYTAILRRRLDWPVINLGFSGSGKMEQAVVDLIAELDPAVFVIDCLPNMEAPLIRERLEPLVRTLRKGHAKTPILLVDNIIYCNAYAVGPRRMRVEASNAAQAEILKQLLAAGVRDLHHVPAVGLMGDDDEGTVDGTHPTDLGFLRIADALAPALRKILPS